MFVTIAAALNLIGVVTGNSNSAGAPALKSCEQVTEYYDERINQGDGSVRLYTEPGPDGVSLIDASDDARRCGLDNETAKLFE